MTRRQRMTLLLIEAHEGLLAAHNRLIWRRL